MSYNRENYRRIKAEYEGKNLRAKDAAEARRQELYMLFPDIREIDDALSETGLKIFGAATKYSGAELEKVIETLRRDNLELQKMRADCLLYHGYPADYSDVKYECPDCMDTGFVEFKICHCMKDKLIKAGYESSGIGNLMQKQTFESFDINYQKNDPKAFDNIKTVYDHSCRYASEFSDKERKSLLFIGATGLGKTHLSMAIAKTVIERGYDVVYDTAQNIFGDFEYERFNRPYGNADGGDDARTDKYFECDLLIIDDLGTEMSNQFTVSCLYNIINTRLNRDMSIIINTNLTRDELRKRYADRITSRLFGEFLPVLFFGRDVREMKLN